MPAAAANGITIEYTTTGDPDRPPLLLIMGLGAQLTAWDDQFVDALAERGLYVIRFDNRDMGRSTWFDEAGAPDLTAIVGGAELQPAYLLADMAADAAGLLDALGIPSAHIVGASMGGMIAQSFAIQYPDRVRTLVSIMSTTGDPSVGQPHPEILGSLVGPPPADRAAAIDQAVKMAGVIGSTGFPFNEERLRANAAASYDRAFHPDGTARQAVAVFASPDRTSGLAAVRVPTLVIHGEADPLIDLSGGRATADAIPGAALWIIPGMGHDLPPELFKEIADRVAALALG
jgi:pimeloyl-ACP methyl ester carboxylesterase